jgi:hypothetical protein
MKQLIFILILCIALPSVSFAASIEQERMLESIKQEEDEQQKQREQQAVQPVYIIVPTGYCDYPVGGKHHPDGKPQPKPHPGNKLNPKPCPVNK